jgi:hypothetical protein
MFPFEIIYLTDYFGSITNEYLTLAYNSIVELEIDAPAEPKRQSFFTLSRTTYEDADEFVISLLF